LDGVKVVVDEEILREVEERLWISIRDNFNYAYDYGELTPGRKIDLLNNADKLKKYRGTSDYIDIEYKVYLVYVKFLTEEDLSDNVKITENYASFHRCGPPGFLDIDIFKS
jgi:hypothetical protein